MARVINTAAIYENTHTHTHTHTKRHTTHTHTNKTRMGISSKYINIYINKVHKYNKSADDNSLYHGKISSCKRIYRFTKVAN